MRHKQMWWGALALMAAGAVQAGPADYVYSPTVEYGEREIDFKSGNASKKGESPETAASIGFGYGATEWWFTELYAKYKQENGEPTKFDAVEWENKFQLTETGRYPVDLGFLLEIERPKDRSEGYEVKFGPLLQSEFGKIQVNANLLFQRNYRAGFANDTQLGYQLQVKYRYRPEFEYGVQAFGDLGKWSSWNDGSEQSHRIGPAIFGKIKVGEHQAIRYNLAYLVGTSDAAPDRTLRSQVEYEF